MKKFLTFVTAFALLSQSALAFSDISKNHPNFVALDWLQDTGVIEGYSDGTFRPDQPVNRAEFLKMLYGAMDEEVSEGGSVKFSDVEDAWYKKYVVRAYKDGVIDGYPDGTFRPDANINLVEAVKIVTNAFLPGMLSANGGYAPCHENLAANPVFDSKAWYWNYLKVAESKCLLGETEAYKTAVDRPERLVTRAVMAELLFRSRSVSDNGGAYYNGRIGPREATSDFLFDIVYRYRYDENAKVIGYSYPDGEYVEFADDAKIWNYFDGWYEAGAGMVEFGDLFYFVRKKVDQGKVMSELMAYTFEENDGDDLFYYEDDEEYLYLLGFDVKDDHRRAVFAMIPYDWSPGPCSEPWGYEGLRYVDLDVDDPERKLKAFEAPAEKVEEAEALSSECEDELF